MRLPDGTVKGVMTFDNVSKHETLGLVCPEELSKSSMCRLVTATSEETRTLQARQCISAQILIGLSLLQAVELKPHGIDTSRDEVVFPSGSPAAS